MSSPPRHSHAQTKVATKNQDRRPLLLTMGAKDHTVPEAVSKSTYKQYQHSESTTELTEFADRGHSLTIDHGWREIADSVLSCLKGKGDLRQQRSLRRDATPPRGTNSRGDWPNMLRAAEVQHGQGGGYEHAGRVCSFGRGQQAHRSLGSRHHVRAPVTRKYDPTAATRATSCAAWAAR
jgi:hypothetical protein